MRKYMKLVLVLMLCYAMAISAFSASVYVDDLRPESDSSTPPPPRPGVSSPVTIEPYVPPGVKMEPSYYFRQYLEAQLSDDDYTQINNLQNQFTVWYVNLDAVRRVVRAYDGEGGPFTVTYEQAKYSRATLLRVEQEVCQAPALARLDACRIGISEKGVTVPVSDPQMMADMQRWLETYEYKECVILSEPLVEFVVPTNPA